MDEMARALGVDALEFRLTHLKDERMRDVLNAVAQKIGWPKPSAAGRVAGIACGTEKAGYVATAAEVSQVRRRLQGRAHRHRLRVRRDRESRRAEEPGRRLGRAGPRRRAVRGDRVRRRPPAERHDGASTACRGSRTRRSSRPSCWIAATFPSAGAGESSMIAVAPAIGSAVRGFGKVDTALPIRLL